MHKFELDPFVVERIKGRRGQLHIHDRFEPARTAFVVVDLQLAFMAPGYPMEVPMARAIVPTVNRLADAVRAAGCTVVWVRSSFTADSIAAWKSMVGGIFSAEAGTRVLTDLVAGADGHALWPDLAVRPEDMIVDKNRFSAFLPGASDLGEMLQARGIDTVLIGGTLTQVCCESSARDAMMRNFHVVMVPDANASVSDALHNNSLSALALSFADVMTADEVIARMPAAASRAPEAAAAG